MSLRITLELSRHLYTFTRAAILQNFDILRRSVSRNDDLNREGIVSWCRQRIARRHTPDARQICMAKQVIAINPAASSNSLNTTAKRERAEHALWSMDEKISMRGDR